MRPRRLPLSARTLGRDLEVAREKNLRNEALCRNAGSFDVRPTGAMLEHSTLRLLWASSNRRRDGCPRRHRAGIGWCDRWW